MYLNTKAIFVSAMGQFVSQQINQILDKTNFSLIGLGCSVEFLQFEPSILLENGNNLLTEGNFNLLLE